VVRTWNSGAERLFGYSDTEILGQNTRTLFTPEDQAKGEAEKELERARQDGCSGDERWHLRKNGERFFVSGTVRPLFDGDGELRGFLKIARDITPRQLEKDLLEKTVADRTGQLRQTVQELEAFSYSVAHDLRSPLRSMQAYATLLIEEAAKKLDADQIDYLRQIARSASRLDTLIRDVLSYAQTARAEAPLAVTDFDSLVREVIATYPQFSASGANVQIEGHLPKVKGNPALLTQCISNLIGNGVKFVPAGRRPELKIRAEEIEGRDGDPGGRVRIYFQDNGIGIAPENRNRIFRIFERLQPARQFEGTGIGLAIVRRAVERMHGTAGFESQPGNGSTFWIELPKGNESAT